MRYVDLEVYKRSFAFALRVHELTQRFPPLEQTELARQLRRSSKSIVSNLAEGTSRFALSKKEQQRFLVIAVGSADESKLWLTMSHQLRYLSDSEHQSLAAELDEIGKMLYGLWKRHNSSL